MIRLIGILIGLGFTAAVVWAFGWGVAAVGPVLSEHGSFVEPTAEHEFHEHPKELALASDGAFGKWDLQQLQRGTRLGAAGVVIEPGRRRIGSGHRTPSRTTKSRLSPASGLVGGAGFEPATLAV